jgi:hypothetical protein
VLHEYDGITAVLKEITNLQGQGEHHEVLLARATMALANLTGSFETSQIVARPKIIRTIIMCLKSAIDQITVKPPPGTESYHPQLNIHRSSFTFVFFPRMSQT